MILLDVVFMRFKVITNSTYGIYLQLTFRRLLVTSGFTLALIGLFLADLAIGSSGLSLHQVLEAIFQPERCDSLVRAIVWDYRLPWSLMAVVVGFSLGLAGAVMQTILNNPLASPYTLGVSVGAGFGAAMVYALGLSLIKLPRSLEIYIVPLNAFIFALLTCVLIIGIGRVRGFTYETLILAGIAVSFLFHSLLSLMEYFASEEALQAIVFWLFGSLLKATMLKVAVVSLVLVASMIVLMRYCWEITILRLGDDKAQALGVNPGKVRLITLIVVSILTAVAVCFVGIIGFIGLVAPHIARFLVGDDARFLLPVSGLAGACMLSAAAIACKSIIPGSIIPIGIVTSFVGVPFFLYLVLRGKRGVW